MSFTRREVLASLIGGPAALAAGCGQGVPLPPAGEMVGANFELGHLVRSPFAGIEENFPRQKLHTVIVGAGIAGLSAAWHLANKEHREFCLLELETSPGGTARSGASQVSAFPWGAHYLPVPLPGNERLIALLDEMGLLEGRSETGAPLVAEQFLCREPEERLFVGGKWHEGLFPEAMATPDDIDQWRRFQAEVNTYVAWRDGAGRRAFAVPADAGSNDADMAALDALTFREWLARRGFNSPRLLWLVEYACRDDYGATLDQVSAWAGLFYFCARVVQPGAGPQPLITWPEGNGRLVQHLADKLGDRLVTGAAVVAVVPGVGESHDQVDVVARRADGTLLAWRAQRVIFAAPQFVAPYVVRGYREARGAAAAQFEYGSWLVANLHLSGRPAEHGFPLAWDNVIYDSRSLGYVVATHQSGSDHGPSVFTWYLPLLDDNPRAGREQLLSFSWNDCAAAALADLAVAHPDLPALVTRLDCQRWGHAMIRPRPGFRFGPHRAAALAPFRGVHFAHSDLSGLPLFEEAFFHGLRAADEVLLSASGA